MPERRFAMADATLTLTSEEREFLVEHLQMTLSQTRIEEHRTDSLKYRERVHRDEQLLENLLAKLRDSGR
jgi:hypothetical protein